MRIQEGSSRRCPHGSKSIRGVFRKLSVIHALGKTLGFLLLRAYYTAFPGFESTFPGRLGA